MPTTFNVVSLGVIQDEFGNTVIIDPVEGSGNTLAENASQLVGLTFGGASGDFLTGQSLLDRFVEFSPGQPGANSGTSNLYDQDNDPDERFRIDGGPSQTFDAVAEYQATITYLDGTTATITATIFQDVLGNTYWAPELTQNADQDAMEAKPIASITLVSLTNDNSEGLIADRDAWEFAPCFTVGTLISTPLGKRPIEQLNVGDEVITKDNGPQVIRWLGQRTVAAKGKLAPVRICAGAIGAGIPSRDMLVSRQHRMLLSSRIAERMFGTHEVLVPAIKLTELPGIYVDETLQEVTYLHIKTDQHDILFAEEAPTESLFIGQHAEQALGSEAITEIFDLFQHLLSDLDDEARPFVDGKPAKNLLRRHVKNRVPLIDN